MTRPHPARASVFLLAVALALAACGGPATESPTSGVASEPASVAPSTPSPAASEEASPDASGLGFDLGEAAGSVSDLTSYELDITFDDGTSGEQVLNVVATKEPVPATHYTMEGFELISIEGEGAWLNQNGTWVAAPGGADAYMSIFDAMAPDTLIGAYSLGAFGSEFADQGSEERNGVQTTHYHLDSSTAPATAGFPPDGAMDVWIASDGGYLVAMAFSGTDPDSGQEVAMSIEVSRVNDSSISIEPPI